MMCCAVKTKAGRVQHMLWALAMPCVFAPALQEVGTVKAKAIPTGAMEEMLLGAQLGLQYAKSSLFTCPASQSGAVVSKGSGGSSSST